MDEKCHNFLRGCCLKLSVLANLVHSFNYRGHKISRLLDWDENKKEFADRAIGVEKTNPNLV